jgi:hypothetical protein
LIHGISDKDGPYDFEQLWENLGKEYFAIHKTKFDEQFTFAPIKWDIATNDGEKSIFETCFGTLRNSDRYLVHGNWLQSGKALADTRAWRYFATFLAGDVIAYVDEADNKIRATVWDQMRKYLDLGAGQVCPFSIIGHSLGSVIAYDFIFALMQRNKIFDFAGTPKLDETAINNWKHAFQNLYTMGSPIGLFMMRHRDLWQNDFAKLVNPVEKNSKLRFWLNIWDKDDLVAYPLEKIFKNQDGKALTDVEVDTGMLMPWAHTKYWEDAETARAIADTLPAPK